MKNEVHRIFLTCLKCCPATLNKMQPKIKVSIVQFCGMLARDEEFPSTAWRRCLLISYILINSSPYQKLIYVNKKSKKKVHKYNKFII